MTEVRKIAFKHSKAAGDAIMFSAGIRDFKLLFPDILINVDSNQPWVWQNNPYIDRSLHKNNEDVEYYPVGYPAINCSNNGTIHFTQMFLLNMIAKADFHHPLPVSLGEFCSTFSNGNSGRNNDKQILYWGDKYKDFCKIYSRQWGDIHLSDKELEDNLILDSFSVDKYWVIAPGGKRDCTAKIWDWRRFQEVIDYFDGLIKFVVIGKSDLLVEKLNGVIDLTDRFNKDMRPLVPLVFHAEGCVSGPSMLMHLAAALPTKYGSARKPCVTILGGREPSSWTWYCNHQVLHTNGIFTCSSHGGCWKARTHPLPKDPQHNGSLCSSTVKLEGRTIQACMNTITSKDVIRAIERYYEGDIYTYSKPKERVYEVKMSDSDTNGKREINLLGNLNTDGGGEQSFVMISDLLKSAGYKVNLYPWGSVHEKFQDLDLKSINFKDDWGKSMAEQMKPDIPLLFYANDCVWDFAKYAEDIIKKSSKLILGLNYAIGGLKKCDWLAQSGKLSDVIFQNQEKLEEWENQTIGYNGTRKRLLYGAIDIDRFYEVCTSKREKDARMVVLKHCKPDFRKYVTTKSEKSGEKIHIWQKKIMKENDVKFYHRLLSDTKNVYFEFMEAHEELVEAFSGEERMIFHKWNSLDVGEFLSRGHVYLYRTSNMWRDQYPRVVAEALTAGLPILTEPRDGTKDRVIHGDTGFYCIDYDGFLYALKLLQRKEDYRYNMGLYAKDWAKKNLDPRKWVQIVNESY